LSEKGSRNPVDKKLHPQAASVARHRINEFATSLILQSKILAYRRGDDEVQSSHVLDALRILNRNRSQSRKRSIITISGSGMFGVFLSQFVTQTLAGNTLFLAVFAIVGLLGLALIFYGTGQE
jgi:hypothetical protein